MESQESELIAPPEKSDPRGLASNENYWRKVARQYSVDPDFVNLEAGYFGLMARPILREYTRRIEALNASNSHYMRTHLEADYEAVRERVARLLRVSPEEIAFTRNATEALQHLIGNYKNIKAGDTVLYADLDYPDIQQVMNWLQSRRGAVVAKFDLPEPATRQAVLDAYERALAKHPQTKLLLVTHMSNRTGLVPPTKDIVAMARARGVDVVVDAAHSWAHLDWGVPDLGCDFAGFNLHKWLGAPLGAGFMYIRKERLDDIDIDYADDEFPPTDIRSRIHMGTWNVAVLNTIPTALDFHLTIGARNKDARLRYLRDRWALRAPEVGPFEVLTPNEPGAYGAITSFRMTGKVAPADNKAIAKWLMDRHRIFTVAREGVANGACVRVTPALYNTVDQVDALVDALRELGRNGLPT
ncbi:aminotransferase class V-fold PLP-dependent enzyme [Pendulispora albinea]|uniref:Aminotransferase class V-fold PLP-dependent enzyme n=1 Tax=Pendulispora albinea TaxID=2741071 RepID=A0ABZ2LRF8_9BACT